MHFSSIELFARSAIIIYFITFVLNPSLAQTEQRDFKVEVPPSPNSSAFMKYGDYPVVLNTGTIPISIPIYEINSGKNVVPISLSYHASGIQVGQIASSVGLGWTLNAGGVISRMMRGMPDEKTQFGFFDLADSIKLANEYTDVTADRQFLFGVISGNLDTSPDRFNINVPGVNAQFTYSKTLQPLVIPYQQVKIEGGPSVEMDHFVVTGTDGTIYRFGQSVTGADTKETSTTYMSGPDPDPYVSSWYLSEIISSDYADTIYFEYDTHDLQQYAVSSSQTYNHTYQYDGIPPEDAIPTHELSAVSHTVQSIDDVHNIKRITYRGGKVEFTNETHSNGLMKVTQIVVYENIGGYTEIKRFKLNYSAFNDTEVRLKLVSVQEGKGAVFTPPHILDYNEEFTMPAYGSPNRDMWGFYNGANNSSLIPPHVIAGNTYGSANRNVSSVHMDTYTLNKITYPTGGSTTFLFEPHEIDNTIIGGGLRVKQLINKDHLGIVTSRKTYVYENQYWARTTMESSYQLSHESGRGPYPGYHWQWLSEHHNSSYLNAPSGSPINYSKVIEYSGDDTLNTGKTEYEYWAIQDYGPSYLYPFPEANDNSDLRSRLLKKTVFVALGGNQYSMVSQLRNYYSIEELSASLGLQVKWKIEPHEQVLASVEATTGGPSHPNPISVWVDIHDEIQKINFVQLDSTSETVGELVKTTVFDYDNKPDYFQVTSVETTNSDNKRTKKLFRYATDLTELAGLTTDEQNALSMMEARNIIEIPVQTELIDNGSTSLKNSTLYKIQGSSVIPKRVVNEYSGGEETYTDIAFDDHIKLIETKPKNNVCESRIWDFDSTKPVAVVKGACSDEIAYSGFETDSNGYWSVASGGMTQAKPIALSLGNQTVSFITNATQTANYSYSMTKTPGPSPELHFVAEGGATYVKYLQLPSASDSQELPAGHWQVSVVSYSNISAVSVTSTVTEYVAGELIYGSDHFSGLRSIDLQPLNSIQRILQKPGNYTVAFAYKGGEVNLNLTHAMIKGSTESQLLENWKLKTIEIEATQVNAILILSGSGLLDDLRLHPAGAQMTTMAYAPGVLTAVSDMNNMMTYYSYDALGRLETIRDADGHILKKFELHYGIGQ